MRSLQSTGYKCEYIASLRKAVVAIIKIRASLRTGSAFPWQKSCASHAVPDGLCHTVS